MNRKINALSGALLMNTIGVVPAAAFISVTVSSTSIWLSESGSRWSQAEGSEDTLS